MSSASLWIFGYGSLVWRPAFAHLRACPASIQGYTRRFWQGSTDHRGRPGRPGRVVTLLPEDQESLAQEPSHAADACWGTAYEISHSASADVLAGLDHRERGGYIRVELEIQLHADHIVPEAPTMGVANASAAVEGLVYIAGPSNANYLGAASIEEIGRQVAAASGPSGANPDYVFELASSLRAMRARDEHVFAVEAAVRDALAGRSREFESRAE